jgi:hypothetical protein
MLGEWQKTPLSASSPRQNSRIRRLRTRGEQQIQRHRLGGHALEIVGSPIGSSRGDGNSKVY